jgi:hypothetical protein
MNVPLRFIKWKKNWILPIILTSALNFAFVDHLVDFHVHSPQEEENSKEQNESMKKQKKTKRNKKNLKEKESHPKKSK